MTPAAVVCGLAAEARIVQAFGFAVGCGGSDAGRAAAHARRLVDNGARALISFGVAGALDPTLVAGDLVIATAVVANGSRWPSAAGWGDRVAGRLPDCRRGPVAGSPAIVGEVAAKRRLHGATGALIVDLESLMVARVAADVGIPFLVVRAVADAAHRPLPIAALAMVGADGRVALGRVARALVRHPTLVGALLPLALAQRRALAALKHAAAALAQELPA